jgi:hypothetical protein
LSSFSSFVLHTIPVHEHKVEKYPNELNPKSLNLLYETLVSSLIWPDARGHKAALNLLTVPIWSSETSLSSGSRQALQ